MKNGYKRGWSDHRRQPVRRPSQRCAIPARRPRKQPGAEDETWLAAVQDECAVRKFLVRRFVEAALSGGRNEALQVQLIINCFGTVLVWV